MMANEHVFFNDANIYVSNTRVVLGGTTYATANLTSVSKRFTPASKGCAVALIVIGGLMTLGSLGTVFSKDFGSGLVMFVICAGIAAAGVAWFRSLKPTHHVILASASGEQEGMSSKDHELVDRVVSAITNAITSRG
jgi:predicted ABC-type sugar transport system permease subunit